MSAPDAAPSSSEKERTKERSTFSTDLSVLPPANSAYLRQEYWEERYKKESTETHFDWCLRPDILLPLLSVAAQNAYFLCELELTVPLLPSFLSLRREELVPDKTSRILMLGCGNSLLSEVMYASSL
jgi:hypothetical protein